MSMSLPEDLDRLLDYSLRFRVVALSYALPHVTFRNPNVIATTTRYATQARLAMGHIIYVEPGQDQGPVLNRISMAMYTIAIVFVTLRQAVHRTRLTALANACPGSSYAAASCENTASTISSSPLLPCWAVRKRLLSSCRWKMDGGGML
jgi:hypothetical protein